MRGTQGKTVLRSGRWTGDMYKTHAVSSFPAVSAAYICGSDPVPGASDFSFAFLPSLLSFLFAFSYGVSSGEKGPLVATRKVQVIIVVGSKAMQGVGAGRRTRKRH